MDEGARVRVTESTDLACPVAFSAAAAAVADYTAVGLDGY